jgi:hypothetical protein
MKYSNNLLGKSKTFLVMLLVWQILKLILMVGGVVGVGVAIVAALLAVAGFPLLLVGLGALLVLPTVSAQRKRAFTIAWW